jgi:hypothetical protein
MSLQPVHVVSRIPPCVLLGQEVIDFHLVPIRKVQTAGATSPWLLLQESGDARGDVWMVSSSCAPVAPVSGVGTTCALDFPMSRDGGVGVAGEAGSTVGGWAGPSCPVVSSPVCARDPVLLRVGVAGDCPSLPHGVDGVGKRVKAPGTGHMRGGIAPATHLGLQRLPQRLLSGVLMMVNRRAQLGPMAAERRLAGFDTRFETMQASWAILPRMGFSRWVLSAMKAEAVESRRALCCDEGGGEARLAGFPSESQVLPPLCRHVLTWPNELAILVEDPQGIGRDHAFGRLKASAPTPWHPRADDRLSTVQGHVGKERGKGPAWHGPFCSGEPLAGILHPRLQPAFPLAAEAWARVDRFEDGCMSQPGDAFGDVGLQNVCGCMADARDKGFDRIVPGPARSEAGAVGCKACFPGGFEPTVGHRVAGAVV